jgi:hypothetical protein
MLSVAILHFAAVGIAPITHLFPIFVAETVIVLDVVTDG